MYTADVAAALPRRLDEIRRETEEAFANLSAAGGALVDARAATDESLVEVAAVDRRLREHSNELRREAQDLEECRALLATRAQARREHPSRSMSARGSSDDEMSRKSCGSATTPSPWRSQYSLRSLST